MPAAYDVPTLFWTLMQAARAAGFEIEEYGRTEHGRLMAFHRREAAPRGRIYLSAGMHGDEPAPPVAILEMLQRRLLPEGFDWHLCPLLNPGGLALGTRENPGGLDVNRDYRDPQSPEAQAHRRWLEHWRFHFDLSFCLHEDWEARGFYLYQLNPAGGPTFAAEALRAASSFIPPDPSPEIDGRPAVGGLMQVPPLAEMADFPWWAEAMFLALDGHTALNYTLETPTGWPMAARVAAQIAAVQAVLRARFPGVG